MAGLNKASLKFLFSAAVLFFSMRPLPRIRDYFLPRKTPLSPLGGQVVHGVPSLETATCWAFPEKLVITSIERLAASVESGPTAGPRLKGIRNTAVIRRN